MLCLRGLRKTFGNVLAVDRLSLEVQRGELFGLLGPNGAGKTTTINLAVGLLHPDEGTVEVDGAGCPTDPHVRARIGVAPQALALYADLSAEENLCFFGRLYGLSGPRLRRRVDEAIRLAALDDRRRDRVKTYSGGMQRRLNLAAALVHDPQIIMLDEPTAGVDPQSRNAIFDLVTSLKQAGRTIVYTTHYIEEAQRLCDRVAIMDHGRLLAVDSVDGLIATYAQQSCVVIDRPTGQQRVATRDPRTELAAALEDPSVLAVRVERPDLESVFLSLTGRSLRD